MEDALLALNEAQEKTTLLLAPWAEAHETQMAEFSQIEHSFNQLRRDIVGVGRDKMGILRQMGIEE